MGFRRYGVHPRHEVPVHRQRCGPPPQCGALHDHPVRHWARRTGVCLDLRVARTRTRRVRNGVLYHLAERARPHVARYDRRRERLLHLRDRIFSLAYHASLFGGEYRRAHRLLHAGDRHEVFHPHPRTADCRAAGVCRPRQYLHHPAAYRRAGADARGGSRTGNLVGLRLSIRAERIRGLVLSLETASFAKTVPALARLTGWIDHHHLLPNMFTEGFLIFAQSMTDGHFFLAGDYSGSGWWYYFPLAFLIKTPLGFLVLLAIGVAVCLRRPRELGRLNECFLFVPIAIYLAAAMNNPFQVGVRHILPIYPFLLVITAAGVQTLVQTRLGRVVLAAPVAMYALALASVYPHTLTFFNVLVGGPRHGSEYLADSNIDWGQDLKLLKSWMTRRDIQRVHLAYFGSADPEYYGIDYAGLPAATPGFRLPDASERWSRPTLPGYVAVSATVLTGVYLDPQWRLFYSGLRRRTPTDVIGNSIFVYWLDRWPDADYTAYPDLESGDADWRLGNELLDVQWFRRAIVHYQRVLSRHPDQPSVLRRLGASRLASGDAASAIPPLERAVALSPESGRGHLLLARALFENRASPDQVILHAERSVALLPANTEALLLLARAFGVRGDLAEGSEIVTRALSLDPANVEAMELTAAFRKVMARGTADE